ncbi:MAG TPA: hypothetical protein VM305_04150 [Candidatus Limnocylindrales bacterium]|nr:hypothetical protein [Candidatus Limnocylindrales bacterium]
MAKGSHGLDSRPRLPSFGQIGQHGHAGLGAGPVEAERRDGFQLQLGMRCLYPSRRYGAKDFQAILTKFVYQSLAP